VIDLYGMSSPNVTKILIMLEELDVRYRLHHINVFQGDQFDAGFRELNPLGKVPLIVQTDELGRRVIFESGAILIYLAEQYGRFLEVAARYEILEWLMVQLCNIGPMFGQFTHFRLVATTGNEYSLERYRNLALRLYRLVDARLADRQWLAGDSYSIADIAAYPWMLYVDWHGLAWADLPNLKKWSDAIGARPAVTRASILAAQMRSVDTQSMGNASPDQLDRFFARTR
jgi:GST-like protein